ncbi:hypothetical protein D3C74_453040 [compost metagenome]
MVRPTAWIGSELLFCEVLNICTEKFDQSTCFFRTRKMNGDLHYLFPSLMVMKQRRKRRAGE